MKTEVICRSAIFAAFMTGTACMAQSDLKESYGDFAFDMFGKTESVQMAEEEYPGNLVISPLSMQMALGMLMNGAGGTTQAEIQQALHVSDFTTEDVNQYNKMLIEELSKPTLPDWVVDHNNNVLDFFAGMGWEPDLSQLYSDEGTPVVEIANSMWMDDELSYLDSFRETNQTFYDAELKNFNLGQKSSMDQMDEWIKEKTHGMIPGAEITPDVLLRMILINITYFKGGWKNPFEKEHTNDGYFYNYGITQVKTPMMSKRSYLKYSKVNGVQAIRLDYGYSEEEYNEYGDSRFSMTMFLPEENIDYSFDYETWKNSCAALSGKSVDLRMPRFMASNKLDLVDVLQAMGISNAFDYVAADFSNLTKESDIHLSAIKQSCIVEVDEEGTTAAALTFEEMAISGPGAQPEYTNVSFDHPFYFTIEDNATGTILFMGHVRCVEGEATSIDDIEAYPHNSQSYDIYGRQQNDARGLLIRDGKVRYVK